jgi:hypothetical protein
MTSLLPHVTLGTKYYDFCWILLSTRFQHHACFCTCQLVTNHMNSRKQSKHDQTHMKWSSVEQYILSGLFGSFG